MGLWMAWGEAMAGCGAASRSRRHVSMSVASAGALDLRRWLPEGVGMLRA